MLSYAHDYVYPTWAQALGMCLAMLSMICIPIYAVYKLLTSPGTTLLEVKKNQNIDLYLIHNSLRFRFGSILILLSFSLRILKLCFKL